MKVESINIKNFKAISSQKIEIKGNNVYVIGPNGVGKTSFIDSVFKIISGKGLPSKITKEGEHSGLVEINLGDVIVNARFGSNTEKLSLTIESKDGAYFKKPRTLLDEMAGIVDFDINSFFQKSAKDQVDFIKQLVGIDFTDLDEEFKKIYDERTYINKRVKELEVKQITFDKSKDKHIDISSLQEEIEKANKVNTKITEVKTRFTERDKKIEELKNQLATEESLQIMSEEWLNENKEIDVSSIQSEISSAIEHNEEVNNTLNGLKLLEELQNAIADQVSLNGKLQDIEDTKRRIISETEMPVPGLTFDNNQLLYNGLPFEKSQINTAQLIIIGLQINLALLKDIKIARFDGSLLDNKNLAIVEKWAEENGLQLFVEFVERDAEGLKIEIKEDLKPKTI